MTTGSKVAIGLTSALVLYLLFGGEKTAAAADKPAIVPEPDKPKPPAPGTPLPKPAPPAAGFPAPVNVTAQEAAVYVVIVRPDGSAAPWGPFQVATIPLANADNPGYIVDQINHSPTLQTPPQPYEAVQVFTTTNLSTVLFAFAYQGGVTVTQTGITFTVVVYDGTDKAAPYGTLTQAGTMPGATVYPSESNGTGDGSVQRARALALATKNGGFAAVYGADGNLAIDPKYSTNFVVSPGHNDS